MKRMFRSTRIAMLLTALIASAALAQPQPPPGGGPGHAGPGGPGHGGPPGGGGGGMGGMGEGRGHRPGGQHGQPPPRHRGSDDGPGLGGFGGGNRGGGVEPPEMQFVRLFRGYLDLVQQVTDLSRDPSAAGVSAVLTASDILKARSNNDAIAFFNEILPSVKDETVRRAIQLQLVDLYKNSNQHDKALEQLRSLIAASPTTGPSQ